MASNVLDNGAIRLSYYNKYYALAIGKFRTRAGSCDGLSIGQATGLFFEHLNEKRLDL